MYVCEKKVKKYKYKYIVFGICRFENKLKLNLSKRNKTQVILINNLHLKKKGIKSQFIVLNIIFSQTRRKSINYILLLFSKLLYNLEMYRKKKNF